MADGKEGRTRTSRHPFAIAYDAVDVASVGFFRDWIDKQLWRQIACIRYGLRAAFLTILDQGPRRHLPNTVGNPAEWTLAYATLVFSDVIDRFPGLRLCWPIAAATFPMASPEWTRLPAHSKVIRTVG